MRDKVIKILTRIINILQGKAGRNINIVRNEGIYDENPSMSIVVQFFNKKDNISRIWNSVSKTKSNEVIILEDGSSDDSFSEWIKLAKGKNHFVIRSNDLFEVRTYDRAIDFARGKYIALLQDDDMPPPSSDWVDQAEALFSRFEDLAIIGGRSGLSLFSPGQPATQDAGEYSIVGNVAEIPGLFRYKVHHTPSLSCEGIPFEFAEVVNRAPMFVRKSAIKALGGIDQTFAPFQCDDVDICLKAWLSGYKIGLYDSKFARNIGVGGMRLYNQDSAHISENWRKIYQRYGESIKKEVFSKLVSDSNETLLK